MELLPHFAGTPSRRIDALPGQDERSRRKGTDRHVGGAPPTSPTLSCTLDVTPASPPKSPVTSTNDHVAPFSKDP